MHFAAIGWILPQLHDPDGHEIRFCTTHHHSRPGAGPLRAEDPVESAARRERASEGRA
ncbi:hypothetical protein [Streptomyces siamensis]|uniref:Uncharacterized protein n=1 Tax=Streptomyces siamensis TaxID=1274986 RepID=A0ABP9JAE9_9ACTN